MVVLALHEKVVKALPVVRLATHKLLKSVDAAVGLELLATTLADKHMVTMLPNFVLIRHWQGHESLVTTLSLVFCPTTLIPSSNNINSLTNLPLTIAGPGASR